MDKKNTFCETCERCYQRKPDVELRKDPYKYEIQGNDELFWLCDNCWHGAAEEI